MLYSGTTYSSAIIRTCIKQVVCEKCGCRFAYEMVRRGSGSAHSPYNLNKERASETAAVGAVEDLVKTLVDGEDIVACPNCGWFQESMVASNASRYWYWSPWGAGHHIDPNAKFPHDRGSFPGTPTAVRMDAGPEELRRAKQRAPEAEPDNVLSIRMFQGEFPPVCCNCQGAAETEVLLRKAESVYPPIALPACGRCAMEFAQRERLFKKKLFLVTSGLIFAGFSALGVAGVLMGESDALWFVALGAAAGAVGGAAMVAFLRDFFDDARRIPVKVLKIDWETLIGRLQFADQKYLQAVRAHIGSMPLSEALVQHLVSQGAAAEGGDS